MQARSRLYARRVKGDLDLGLEPSRIDPGGDRRLAEIITPGGLLPGRSEQDILVASEDQNYRIGTRRVMDDRVFHYCSAGEDLNAQEGAFVGKGTADSPGQNYWEGDGGMPINSEGVPTEILPNSFTIYFDNKEAIAVHELRDGWIAGFGVDASTIFCMRIKDNEASGGSDADPTEYCKITLYRGMPVGQTGINHRCYVYPNLYKGLLNTGGAVANQGLAGVMCVPLLKINKATTPYFWGLTWGVFYPLVGLNAIDVATRVNQREFWFDWDGTLIHRGVVAGDPYYQRGGFFLMDGNRAHDAVTHGDQLAMLQIAP